MNLDIGKGYTKNELEEAFHLNFGFKINGIVVRRLGDSSERRLILLFQRSDGPYPDLMTSDRIKYIGAGLHGDQSLKGLNRVLERRGPVDGVFFFHQPLGSAKWTYMGRGYARFVGEEQNADRKIMTYDIELDRRTNMQ